VKAEKVLAIHNEELEKLNKKLKLTQGFRKYKLLLDLEQKRKDRIANLQSTASNLASRMKQLQPSGWKDFLQVRFCFHSKALKYILYRLIEQSLRTSVFTEALYENLTGSRFLDHS